MTGALAAATVARAVAWRTLRLTFKRVDLLVPLVAFPLFFYAAFVGGTSTIVQVPQFTYRSGYAAFEFVFVLLQSAAFIGVFAGFSVAQDLESGFARRLLVASHSRAALLCGHAVAAVARFGVAVAALSAVALATGMRVADGFALAGLVASAAVVTLAAAGWGLGVALRVRSTQSVPLMQAPLFVALFVAPVYVPVALLDQPIRAMAPYNPVTWLLDAGRAALAGHPARLGALLVVAAGLTLAGATWALSGLAQLDRTG